MGRGALGFLSNTGNGYVLALLGESEHIAPDVFIICMDPNNECKYTGDYVHIKTDNISMHNKLIEADKKSLELGVPLDIIIDDIKLEYKFKRKYIHD